MSVKTFARAAMLSAVLAVGSGCSGSDGGPTGPGNRVDGPKMGEPEGEPVCKLLTEAEITEVIGEHDGGQHDYGLGGCVWSAKVPDQDGWTNQIHASVLPEDLYRTVAEIGDPVDGFGEGATYKANYGELWFRCGDEWCGVKAAVNNDQIEQIAKRLAHLLDSRR